MKKTFILTIGILAFAMTSLPAMAASEDAMDPQDLTFYSTCDSSMSADQCMWSPMGGGNYTSCTALGPDSTNPQGQTCQAVIDYGVSKQCVGVTRNASCECDSQTFKLTGRCTYIK